MSERVITFGDDGRLSGILNDAGGESADRPALILFNAGIVHRIGAHRLNVKIARRLGERRIASLRFDLSGLGDSRPAPPGRGFEAQATADISAALDCAVKILGAKTFIAAGMCSGADNSYRAALADDRIAGLILLDPYAYSASGAAIENFIARAADVGRWKNKLQQITKPLSGAGADTASAPDLDDDADQSRPIPPREAFGADLQTLCRRGVEIYLLYTAFVQRQITRPSQFFKTFSEFEFDNHVSVDVVADADHTYTPLAAQADLLRRIDSWIEKVIASNPRESGEHGG